MKLFKKKQPIRNSFSPPRQLPIPKKQSSESDCEMEVRRDKDGRIRKIIRHGNCKKEDVIAFAQSNGVDLNNLD